MSGSRPCRLRTSSGGSTTPRPLLAPSAVPWPGRSAEQVSDSTNEPANRNSDLPAFFVVSIGSRRIHRIARLGSTNVGHPMPGLRAASPPGCSTTPQRPPGAFLPRKQPGARGHSAPPWIGEKAGTKGDRQTNNSLVGPLPELEGSPLFHWPRPRQLAFRCLSFPDRFSPPAGRAGSVAPSA